MSAGTSPPPKEHGLHQRLRERVPLVGHGHRHAQLLADAVGLAQDDFEHRAVDGVVGAVEQRGSHCLAGLAEAIDASLALLVARRVPREVVVDDRVEVVLQVDALRQAVGRDQEPAVGFAEPMRATCSCALGGQLAGDDTNGYACKALRKCAPRSARSRCSGRKPRREPVLDELRQVVRSGLSFGSPLDPRGARPAR